MPPTKIAKEIDGKYKLVPFKEDKKSNEGVRVKVSDIAKTNILNYLSNTSTFNPLIHARLVNSGQYFGDGILDSGAFGGHINNYVSQSIVDKLVSVANSDLATCTCLSTKVCTITGCIQSNKCVNLSIDLYNDIGQTITIDTKARIVKGLPYDFIIGLTTIRQYKLTQVFDALFAEVEGVSALFSEEHSDTSNNMITSKGTKVDVDTNHDSINSSSKEIDDTRASKSDSTIKRTPLAGPSNFYRAHEKVRGDNSSEISCDRNYATPTMGGNASITF